MARSAFVLGNYCEVSEDTERAKAGDFAVVQTVDDRYNGNNGTIWIMKSKETAVQLSKHVRAVDTRFDPGCFYRGLVVCFLKPLRKNHGPK